MKHEAEFSSQSIALPSADNVVRENAGSVCDDAVGYIVVRKELQAWGERGQLSCSEWLAARNG